MLVKQPRMHHLTNTFARHYNRSLVVVLMVNWDSILSTWINCWPRLLALLVFSLFFNDFLGILRQGCEVSVKELDGLLTLLAEKKRKMEQEEAERNMRILLDFLCYLRKQKLDELNEVPEFLWL